jgi:hypothetical protein
MKLRLRKKKNKLAKVLDPECFNCEHPFSGQEKFCPECGQTNKDKRITFGSFLHEVFNGFISWDSKFWTTIIPLLTKPGKVSRDYIDGKRIRYANPFRFYLSVSVVFFLILGATESYDKYKELKTGKITNTKTINDQIDIATIELDSVDIKSIVNNALQDADSIDREGITKAVSKINLDSLKTDPSTLKQLGVFGNWFRFQDFEKNNPTIETNAALDSLKVEKTFGNRFLYSRAKVSNSINNDNEKAKEFLKQIISYISISLFVLLPLFTLFLKFFYIRRKFTYVEHLIFVFHTQTVFFLLLSLFYIVYYIKQLDSIVGIFLLLFLVYLFLAMKRFYKQGYFKTFIKFILLNWGFFFTSLIGFVAVAIIAFAFY